MDFPFGISCLFGLPNVSSDSHGICWTYLSPQPKMQSYAIVWNEALVCPGFPHRKNCKDPAGDVGILDGTHHPLKTPSPRNLQRIWRLWATWLSAGDSVTTVVGLVTFTSLDSRWLSLKKIYRVNDPTMPDKQISTCQPHKGFVVCYRSSCCDHTAISTGPGPPIFRILRFRSFHVFSWNTWKNWVRAKLGCLDQSWVLPETL